MRKEPCVHSALAASPDFEALSAGEVAAGKLLVQVGAQQLSGRGPDELVPLWNIREWWTQARPDHYSVYDVTSFIHQHPGSDLIITDAAALSNFGTINAFVELRVAF